MAGKNPFSLHGILRSTRTLYNVYVMDRCPLGTQKGTLFWRDALAEVSFGEWLKRQRKAEGLTQEQLALQVSCSTSALKKIEAEERHPSVQIVGRLAELFKVPQDERAAFLRFARGDWKSAPTLPGRDAPWQNTIPRTNVPIPLTSFIGREKEVEELVRLLGENRLLTLAGPGGVGKTRLAIQSSNKLLSQFKDGVWWVELAPLTDENLLPQAVTKSLGVREIANQPLKETLSNFLRSKQLLLVLDNCEHLITGCIQLADRLLGTCPNLKILVTSREGLGLTGEEVWSVPILSLPDPKQVSLLDLLMHYEGIRLFVERARAVRSDFSLTELNALSVAQVCQRLDGMPLAIELAAARVKMMSVGEIAKRLDDRFNLLTEGSRAALPRHQTLRAAIDWSYDLLSQPERSFFNRISVFAGGFTLEAAEEVASGSDVVKSQVTDLLGQLINKSLITVESLSEGGQIDTRYSMLETIRQFAYEKFLETGESEQIHQRHRDYFLAFVEEAEPKLKSEEQLAWLDRLELEHDNLRAASNYAIESDTELGLRLGSALLDFWLMRGNSSEGREYLAKLLERTQQWGQAAGRAHALNVAGRLAHYQADFAAARILLEQAIPLARASGDKKEIAFALLWLGKTALRQRDAQSARPLIEEGLAIYQELQDKGGIAMAYHRLAELAAHQGDHRKAEEFFTKALSKYRDFGDRFMAGEVLNALGEVARGKGDYERAGTFYEQALEILKELGSRFLPAIPLFNLAWVSLQRGDTRKATALFQESLKLHREYGYRIGMVEECLGGFAAILGLTGKPEGAARLFGAVESLLEGIGIDGLIEPQDQMELDHYIAAVRAQLDEKSFAKAWEVGRAMTLEQAITYALEDQE